MTRTALILGLAILALGWVGTSAFAEDKTVLAKTLGEDSDFYTPDTVTINQGDTVTWKNHSGVHNVVFNHNGQKLGGDPITHMSTDTRWTADFTFNSPGTFRYFCEEHSDGEFGMVGKVIVKDPSDATPPTITALKAKPAKFCTNKTEDCDKRGTKIKFTLSEAAKVIGDIRDADDGTSAKKVFTKQKKAGKNSISFKGKNLKPGKYVLRLQAEDGNGNRSSVATTNVRVKKKG